MIRIPIGDSGLSAIIDDADELLVAGFNWFIYRASDRLFYARAWNGKQSYLMHRLISGCASNERVDHENRNGLDNRRRNLRIATPSQNGANRIPDRRKRGRTSRYKGVYLDKAREKWGATIHVDGHTRSLGRFSSEEDAAAAYDRAATEAWGRFARLNLEE
jgi:hypothetical protein